MIIFLNNFTFINKYFIIYVVLRNSYIWSQATKVQNTEYLFPFVTLALRLRKHFAINYSTVISCNFFEFLITCTQRALAYCKLRLIILYRRHRV